MRKPGRDVFMGLFLIVVMFAGCSSGESGESADQPLQRGGSAVPVSVEAQCQLGAAEIAARLDEFIASFGDVTPDEFLGRTDIEGLRQFQDDVAQIIARTANQSSTLCNLDGLQVFVDRELQAMDQQSLLANVLVSSIRFGGALEQADVEIGPDDDLLAILGLLDDGSSVTLSAGTFELDVALLVQRDLLIVGAGAEETTIRSTSPDAAVAVFGEGKLTMRDLSVEHVGDEPSSIILAFGAAIDAERIRVSGGVSSDDTSGGNGILLSTGVVSEDGVTAEAPSDSPPVPPSRVVDSEIFGNAIAGITVIGELDPLLASNHIHDNALCGLCFLGSAGGTAQQNLVENNEFGVQVGDSSSPTLVENTSSGNVIAGMVILGTATPTVVDNQILDNGEVGIAVQGDASPVLQRNDLEGHVFGMTFVGTSTASVLRTTVTGAEVGMQVAEQASPEVAESTIVDSVNIGFVHRDDSTGTYEGNTVRGGQAVAALVEGQAQPSIRTMKVEGSEVGVSYRERAGGILTESEFLEPAIGVQLEDEAAPLISSNVIDRPEAAGFVVRSSGDVVITANTIDEPESLGIGAAGESNAVIESNRISGGETAISFVEMAAGEVRKNTLIGQVISIQIGDTASPLIEENEIEDAAGAAIVFRDDAAGAAIGNTIVNPLSVGIQVVERAKAQVERNVLLASFGDDDTIPTATDGELEPDGEADPGTETDADGEADPGTETDADGEADPGTETDDADEADPGTETDDADEADPGTETDEADPGTETDAAEEADEGDAAETGSSAIDEIAGDDSTVGILFAGEAAGTALENQLFGFVIGIQVSESAAPSLEKNLVDGGSEGGVGVLYRDDGAGSADANVTTAHSIGFQVSDQATPQLTNNVIETAVDVGFLVQGTAAPGLSGNTCPAAIPGIGILEQAAPVVGENACTTANG